MKLGLLKKIAIYLIRGITLLFAVSILSFTLISLSPIDPVQAYVGADATVGLEQKKQIAEYWGLNKPPVERYFLWLHALLRGDFGDSLIFRMPVLKVIGERAVASLALMGISWVFAGVIGFTLGVFAAAFKDKWADKAIKSFCLALSSTPTFWLGLLLLMIFAVQLKIFPLALAVPIGKLAADISFAERISHIILPAATLSIVGISPIALHTRQKLIEVLDSDFVLFAFARGESKFSIIKRHGLRNIALPALTLQFASFAELFGGSVLAEQVFSYPGIGRTAVQAGLQNDIPLLLGITLFSAVFVFFGNSIANILYTVFNPQIRSGENG